MKAKIPPVVVMAFVALLMRVAAGYTQHLNQNFQYREVLAWACLGIGLLLGVAGILSFIIARTPVNPRRVDNASRLVVTGIYRFTRNPMYLGLLFFLFFFAARLGNPVSFGISFLFVLWMNNFQIRAEEEALRAKFGKEFEEYVKRTRRWI